MGSLDVLFLGLSKKDIPDVILDFVEETSIACNKRNVALHLPNTREVNYGDEMASNGFFDSEDGVLATATGQPLEDWFPIFVHETCHFDQWAENSKIWTEYPIEYDSFLLEDMTDEMFFDFCDKTYELEFDCDLRTIEKIKNKSLENVINLEEYIQKAHAYTMLYQVLKTANERSFYTIGKEPYNIKEIWNQMPTTFDERPPLTNELFELYLSKCF